MGLGRWLEKRRRSELERINREIEALKTQGPLHFEKEDKGLRSGGKYLKRDTNFGMFVVIGLCLIAIIGLSLYYRQKFSTISDEYDSKVKDLELAQDKLSNMTSTLNETQSKLKFKEKVESDLSKQYSGLSETKEQLETQIADLTQQIEDKKSEIATLKTAIEDKTRKLDEMKDCIRDDHIEDKEDCL